MAAGAENDEEVCWGAAAAGGGGVGVGVEAWEGVDEAELVGRVGLVGVDGVVDGGKMVEG